MITGCNNRGNKKIQHFTVSINNKIDGRWSIPVDVLIEIKKVGKSRFIPIIISDGFGNIIIMENIPIHALLETVGIGISCIFIPEIHRLRQKATIPFGKRL